jgi:hypothetical protein
MAATYARTVEAQAMVVRSQNEKETQMLQIASRAQSDAEKNQILAQIGTMNNETKVFLKSMEETRKNREMLLTQQELEIKKKQGSGI